MVRRNGLVPQRIGFMIDGLKLRMCSEPRQRTAQSLRPFHLTIVIRDEFLYLGIVEHNAIGFVADEASHRAFIKPSNKIGWDVDHVRFQIRKFRDTGRLSTIAMEARQRMVIDLRRRGVTC